MPLDLDRPAKVRRIFDVISLQGHEIHHPAMVGPLLDLYGPDTAARVIDYLTGELNRGQRLDLWEKAGMIYDRFGLD